MVFVYILTSAPGGKLYVGKADDLRKRIEQHLSGAVNSYTRDHAIRTLVYFELHETQQQALTREKLLKRWRRQWKINLIESVNPDWRDVSNQIPL